MTARELSGESLTPDRCKIELMRKSYWPIFGLFLLMLGTIHAPLQAQANPGWIGKRVVPRTGKFTLLVNGEVLDRSGEDVEFYEVEQVDGSSLLLKAESNHASGWAEQDQVIPVEHAFEFFTRQIGVHPQDVFLFSARALLFADKKDYASALRDHDEAVRLDPGHASHYRGRGLVRQFRKEDDKAIADFNEAIKLDPRSARAHVAERLLGKQEGIRKGHRRCQRSHLARSTGDRRL